MPIRGGQALQQSMAQLDVCANVRLAGCMVNQPGKQLAVQ